MPLVGEDEEALVELRQHSFDASRAEVSHMALTTLRETAWLEAIPETLQRDGRQPDVPRQRSMAVLRTERDVGVDGNFVTYSLWASTLLRCIGVPPTEDLRLSVSRLVLRRLPKFEFLDRLCEKLEQCAPEPGRRDTSVSVDLAPPSSPAQRWRRAAALSLLEERGHSPFTTNGRQSPDGRHSPAPPPPLLFSPSDLGVSNLSMQRVPSSRPCSGPPSSGPPSAPPTSPPVPGLGWLRAGDLSPLGLWGLSPDQRAASASASSPSPSSRWRWPLSPLLPFAPSPMHSPNAASPMHSPNAAAAALRRLRNTCCLACALLIAAFVLAVLWRNVFWWTLMGVDVTTTPLFYDVKMCSRYAVARDPSFAVRVADTGGACIDGHVYKRGSSTAAEAEAGVLGVVLRLDDGFQAGNAYLPVVVLGPGQYALMTVSFLDAQVRLH